MHAIPLLTPVRVNIVVLTATAHMLASKAVVQAPLISKRSDVRMRSTAVISCQLKPSAVPRPRQMLTGLAALVLSVQIHAAQASPVKPGLQVQFTDTARVNAPLLWY